MTEAERAEENRSKLKIGDRIKSFDFGHIGKFDSFIVGTVKKIAPIEHCGPECDHIHLEAEYAIPEREVAGTMYYPHLGNHIEIID
tara:strand:- start:297 stop:554 length:258 start_codon:yes stop_codon:yes gene_type:complete